MDKAEYQEKLAQLKALVASQDYDGALDIVQNIDWRRVKNIRTLCMVADVYEANDMLEDCKRILTLALKRASVGKSILSRLVELCLMMNDTAGASEYYQDFIKAAPRDAARYLMQYKILKANQAPLEDQIEALHDYKESEYTERWAYELAKLYDKAGMVEECLEECDDIILWFSEGVYVVRSMELKMKHTNLTPAQQDKYDHRFETMPELLQKEEPKFPKKKKKAAPVQETTAEEVLPEEKPAPVEKKPVLEEFTSTIDLQSRLSQGLKKVIGGMLHDDEEEEEEQTKTDELFANLEEDRFAPKLEAEQPAESGVRRDTVVTKPESMLQEEQATEQTAEFDFSAILEAQADAILAGDEPEEKAQEAAPAEPENPEDDFDLSSILESEVADILEEKQEAAKAAAESTVEATAEIEIPAAEETEQEEAVEEQLSETKEIVLETPEAEETEIPEEVREETPVVEDTQEAEEPEVQVPETEETEPDTATVEFKPETNTFFDLEQQIVDTARTEVRKEEEEGAQNVISSPTLDLKKEMEAFMAQQAAQKAGKAVQLAETPMHPQESAKQEAPQEEAPQEEPAEFNLQELLASEVTQMMAEPEEPEEVPQEPAKEEDLVTRLEKEADRTIEHQELVKETPQEKRTRIMRAAPANRMSEEQKRVFTYFAKVPGMDTQILEALNKAYNGAVSKTSRHGNIAIMGRKGTGKTRLSEGLIKALCKEFEMSAAKYARILAKDLNEKDVAQVVSKLAGGFLVIERASRMSEETILKLNQAMEFRTDSMILIIEDEKEDMKNMLEEHPKFAEKFDAVIKIPVFTNDELVTFARTYAGECGYKMDEMGILALYTIIGANQSVEEPVSIAKVKEMVDAAIAKASKGGRKIGRKLSGRQVDRMNRIILYEKDFEL